MGQIPRSTERISSELMRLPKMVGPISVGAWNARYVIRMQTRAPPDTPQFLDVFDVRWHWPLTF